MIVGPLPTAANALGTDIILQSGVPFPRFAYQLYAKMLEKGPVTFCNVCDEVPSTMCQLKHVNVR